MLIGLGWFADRRVDVQTASESAAANGRAGGTAAQDHGAVRRCPASAGQASCSTIAAVADLEETIFERREATPVAECGARRSATRQFGDALAGFLAVAGVRRSRLVGFAEIGQPASTAFAGRRRRFERIVGGRGVGRQTARECRAADRSRRGADILLFLLSTNWRDAGNIIV